MGGPGASDPEAPALHRGVSDPTADDRARSPAEAAPVSVFPLPPPPRPDRGPGVAAPLASWGRRLGSATVDALVRLAIVAIPFSIGAAVSGGSDAGVGLGFILGYLLQLAYPPVGFATRGQTLGNRAVGIRVIRIDGSRLTGGMAFVREFLVKLLLVQQVGWLTLGVLPLLNYLWPLWDDRHQALHDKIVGTLTVETRTDRAREAAAARAAA